ncbi:ATP synthase F1 subunit gamma [Serpentinicella sp. ANB-PHB4]|uniref:ATP synthase F1 subunit gamma n=1 Tax=Serpentinicella sp. ANB-PHB4 TaxID=3074076 RepID=UPI0028619073|nr:ATP synthase F1 subunit gamma [Serpentinicella sp. ANB-PHB4]MDR5659712.1 ATP synthase F1 subunit gamma [Serpentinicella sp. ANB-PHB4]
MAGVGMRDIKRRIKSVNSTKQITKAMELVSSAKLRKARQRLEQSRSYFTTIKNTVGELMASANNINNPYINKREVKKALYIVITGDRGLCGGYNTNAIKAALNHMDHKDNTSIVAIGTKSRDYFKKRNYHLFGDFMQISENPSLQDAENVAGLAIDLYDQGEVDEVNLVYTEFVSTISHQPKVMKLLPLEVDASETSEDTMEEQEFMEFQPSAEVFLDYLIPKYVRSMVYGALIESATSEQGARRVAMESATDNAIDMIDKLELKYNRARQASITQEIAEIVGGAEALK